MGSKYGKWSQDRIQTHILIPHIAWKQHLAVLADGKLSINLSLDLYIQDNLNGKICIVEVLNCNIMMKDMKRDMN